jgi:magnesium-transporting ATPase (P-type)
MEFYLKEVIFYYGYYSKCSNDKTGTMTEGVFKVQEVV